MSKRVRHFERTIWIAIVAVLATTLIWVSVVSGAALFLTHPIPAAQAFAVLRALGHVAVMLFVRLWPILLLWAIGGIILAFVFGRSAPANGRVRHA